jgi:hypothetical protein
MTPITAEKPWMVAPGNHEGQWCRAARKRKAPVSSLPLTPVPLPAANCNNGGYSPDSAPNNVTADNYCLVGQTNFVRLPGLALRVEGVRLIVGLSFRADLLRES